MNKTQMDSLARTTSRRDFLKGAAVTAFAAALPPAVLAASASPLRTTNQSTRDKGDAHMSTITTKDGTQIFYKDWGSGQPIVFHHGWPLSADDWDNQMVFFLEKGYRVIAHDRRGHGRSTQTDSGNDMDT